MAEIFEEFLENHSGNFLYSSSRHGSGAVELDFGCGAAAVGFQPRWTSLTHDNIWLSRILFSMIHIFSPTSRITNE
jgi:hypothetical protein